MSYVPTEQDLDAINRYLDDLMSPEQRARFEQRLEDEPGLKNLLTRFQGAFGAEKATGFGRRLDQDAATASDMLMRAIAAEEAGDAPSTKLELVAAEGNSPECTDASEPTGLQVRDAFWPQVIKIAACLLLAGGLYFAGQSFSPWGGEPRLKAAEMYAILEDNGFVAPRTCSPEQFPAEMQDAVGVPLAFAGDVPGVELLGWNYPQFLGTAVLSEDEIILMARVDGEGVAVVIDQASNARRLRASEASGLSVYKDEIEGLVLYEIGPFDRSRVLPLLQSTDTTAP